MGERIGLYLHIPFCRQKCLYCDFPSYAGMETWQKEYVDALTAEIRIRGERYKEKKIVSVFLGGGTPTVLPIPLLERLMEAVKTHFTILEDAEITIEANPGTLNQEMAQALRQMGFNRLSMGVQAWQNRLLQNLGRIHTIEDFLENYQAVREAGFENVNVDLMFALPQQSMADWKETLERITALEPEHISAYSLIIEEGTPFYDCWEKGTLQPASEDLDREMYHWAADFLAKKGYQQYEISNFAKAGRQSRHNCIYWRAEEYLGMGLGAHSYLAGRRFHNPYDIRKYIVAMGEPAKLEEDVELLSEEDALAEFMFLGLRLTDGVSFERFQKRFGRGMKEVYSRQIEQLKQEGLLWEGEAGVRLTRRGIDVSNVAFEKFLL